MSKRKKIILIVLVLLTIGLGVLSVFITIQIQQSQAPTTTGAGTCIVGKVVCRGDAGYENLCPEGPFRSGYSNGSVGAFCTDGINTDGNCQIRDACAPTIAAGTQCSGLLRFSCGENLTHGEFVGCSGALNCFCRNSATTYTYSDGMNCNGTNRGSYISFNDTVECFTDSNSDSCAARGTTGTTPVTPPTCTGTLCPDGSCCPTGNQCYNFGNGYVCGTPGNCPDGRAYCGAVGACCAAGANCVNNQCEVPVRYSCNTATHACYQDTSGSGTYSDLASCNTACSVPETKYRCDTTNYSCQVDSNGVYSNLTNCLAGCSPTIACPPNATINVTITTYKNGVLNRTLDTSSIGSSPVTLYLNSDETGVKVVANYIGFDSNESLTKFAPCGSGTAQSGSNVICDCTNGNLSSCVNPTSGYLLNANLNDTDGTNCSKAFFFVGQQTVTPAAPITCYRCTPALNDANACESTTATGSCPTGYTTNASCNQAWPAGICPIYTCGDALCTTGETCEATTAGGSTFRACTPTNISSNSTPTGSAVTSCYGTQYNQPVTNNTCKYCGDTLFTPGLEQCDPTAPATGGNIPASCNTDCTLQVVALQCISLTEGGTDPILGGTGNYINYTFTYQNPATSNPYPNIRLRVGPNGSPEGRDAETIANQLVAPIASGGVSFDSVTSRWTYRFRWEAADPGGVAVSAGTYDVRVMLDGTVGTEVTTPAGCLETITVSAVADQEPLFNILKTGALACDSNGDAVTNYTITVTNIGPVQGIIDFVQDTLDTEVVSLGLTPTNITPSFGTYAAGTITWIGDVSDRTFTAAQQKQYTYTLRVPQNRLINFYAVGVHNQALVQFDTSTTNNNTDSFDLQTMLTCTIPTLPITGILDDARFLFVGLIFMIIGYAIYRYRLGNEFSLNLISNVSEKVRVIKTKLPFLPYEEGMERKMRERIRKENRGKR